MHVFVGETGYTPGSGLSVVSERAPRGYGGPLKPHQKEIRKQESRRASAINKQERGGSELGGRIQPSDAGSRAQEAPGGTDE